MRQRPAVADQVCRIRTSGIAALDAQTPHLPDIGNLHEILYILVSACQDSPHQITDDILVCVSS